VDKNVIVAPSFDMPWHWHTGCVLCCSLHISHKLTFYRSLLPAVIFTLISDPAFAAQASQDMSGYTWVVVYAGVFAFIAAYGIGANDVANSFATSVGAKSITIKQAVILACIFEFAGAVLLGSQVAKTMRKGIADSDCFEDNPQLLMVRHILIANQCKMMCCRINENAHCFFLLCSGE